MNLKSRFSTTHFSVALILLLIAILPQAAWTADEPVKTESPRQELQFTDLNDKSYTFKAPVGSRALVLIFVTTDCPIANSYQPALARLYDEFHRTGFEFVMVHEGLDQSIDKLKEHSKEYTVPFSVVMDGDHSIARRASATKTPEVFVFGLEGEICYQGRIDNLYQSFGKKRATATRDDLRIALTELDSGEPVSVPKTETVGCSIQLK